MTEEQRVHRVTELEYLRRAIEHAPQRTNPPIKGLMGWKTKQGQLFVCAECAGRIMARGCRLPEVTPIWDDAKGETCWLHEPQEQGEGL